MGISLPVGRLLVRQLVVHVQNVPVDLLCDPRPVVKGFKVAMMLPRFTVVAGDRARQPMTAKRVLDLFQAGLVPDDQKLPSGHPPQCARRVARHQRRWLRIRPRLPVVAREALEDPRHVRPAQEHQPPVRELRAHRLLKGKRQVSVLDGHPLAPLPRLPLVVAEPADGLDPRRLSPQRDHLLSRRDVPHRQDDASGACRHERPPVERLPPGPIGVDSDRLRPRPALVP